MTLLEKSGGGIGREGGVEVGEEMGVGVGGGGGGGRGRCSCLLLLRGTLYHSTKEAVVGMICQSLSCACPSLRMSILTSACVSFSSFFFSLFNKRQN